MAEAWDIETEMYDKIRTLLEANTAWTALFKPGNRIWHDTKDPGKRTKADGDRNEVELTYRSGTSGLKTGDETFGTHSDAPPENWVEVQEHLFLIALTAVSKNAAKNAKLRKETVNTMRLAAPRLGGLSYVTRLTVRWEVVASDVNDEGTWREVTNIYVRVLVETQGKPLTLTTEDE